MAKQPNIIWIFGDQHRAQALSCMGDPNVSTPTIDRLALEGVHFRRAVANNPWCCPARFSLLTGLYPHKGVDRTPPPAPMDPALPTIATMLTAAGYHTAWFGKWHLDGNTPGADSSRKVIPPQRRGGFHTFVAYENNNSQYQVRVHGHIAGKGEVEPYRLPGYETDCLTDLLCDEIRRRAAEDKPFFAALSVQPPHVPNVAPRADMARHRAGNIILRPNVPPVPRIEEIARRELAGYYAQIENLDANLQRVLDTLVQTGLADDTLIVFFSDHGDCMGSHGYREKSSPWEESIRVPFVIGGGVPYGPRRYGPVDALISMVDILPTTLGLCGVQKPARLPGFDYSRAILNSSPVPLPGEPDSVYLQHTVRKQLEDGLDRAWRGVVTRDGWKYVCIPQAPFCMFNLNEDPYEMANLAFNTRFRTERARLHERLRQWIADTGDQFDMPEL